MPNAYIIVITTLVVLVSCVWSSPPLMHTRDNYNKERMEDAFESHVHKASNGEIDDHELDHEAILGSRRETQEYNSLTPEESKVRLAKLVENGIDANHDSYVDHEELRSWILKSFINLALEEGEDQLEDEDFNDDGFVTWEEHLKGAFDYQGQDAVDGLRNELIEEDRALWKQADLNKDDKLDAKEFAAFNSPEEFEHMHKALIEQVLARRDKNKDGYIEFGEFITDHHGQAVDPSTEHYISEKDKFHNEYDVNKDLKLDYNECLRWIVPNSTEIADHEAQHLITSADMNHDGRLSLSEIIDNYDVFVGSEATNFGEQLHDEL